MLQKVKYYIEYAQTLTAYIKKVVDLVNVAARDWPVWVPPTQTPSD